jgi:PAS domain S-box-containing protein
MSDLRRPVQGASILLIEDNAGDARLIKELLAEAGTGAFRLDRADRLSTGLACIAQDGPDLVLLDLGLPDSDGLATVAAVRSHSPQLPVIVLTGHDDDRLAVAAVGAGAQDYLVKGRIDSDTLARSIRYAIERKRVADALKESSVFNALLLQTSPLGIDIVDEDGQILFVSPGLEAIVGESPVGRRCWEAYRDDRQQCDHCPLTLGVAVGETRSMESVGVLGERDFEITHTGMIYRGKKAVLEVFHDITERKRAERRDRLAHQVLDLLNQPVGETDTIHELLKLIKATTGVDAVGIRLREGDDFPYYQTNGYPEEFLRTERSLCARNEAGETVRDGAGQAVLECLCGAVIGGQANAAHPGFTEGGSYWTNSTTVLRAATAEAGLKLATRARNRCNDAGYESLALIPLRSGAEIIGLLQLSDRRRDRFSPQAVRFFEGLGASIGIALTRKQAEEALRKNEDQLRTIAEGTQALLMSVDAKGRLTYANDATATALGYASPEELIGRSYLHFVHPADREQVLDTFTNQASTRQPSSVQEFRIRDTDGKDKWLSLVATLAIKEGQVVGQSGVAQDITARKQAEDARQRAEQRYRALFEDAPAMYVITRNDGGVPVIEECNELFCQTLGFGRDELVGRQLADFYSPASRAQMGEAGVYDRVFAGEPVAEERELVTRDGTIVSSMLRAVSEVDAAGNPTGSRDMFVDITESRRAEAEIVRRAAQQTAINAILAAGMKAGADLDSLLNLAIDQTLKALGLATGAIWLAPTNGGVSSFVMRGLDLDLRATLGLLSGAGQMPVLDATVSEAAWSGNPALAETMQATGVSAALTTPLLFNGKVIGGVSVASPTPRAWSIDEVALVEAVGSQLGIVIERARLYEETRQRVNELEAVSRLSRALREAVSLQQILNTLLDETLAILGTDSGDILLHDPASNELRAGVLRGWFANLPDQILQPGEGIAGATVAGGQVIVSREFRSDPRTRAVARDWLPEGWGGACVPLRTADEVVGALFASVRLPREIGPQELRLLNTLAEIGGNAIHRTRLHEQTERQLMEAEALRDVERAVASSFDLSLTLGLVARHASQLLGTDAAAVLVFNTNTHELDYAAYTGFRLRVPVKGRLGITGTCAGRVAMERRMVRVDDLPHKADSGQWPAFYVAEGFVSYCAVPIIAKGALKGVLEVLHRSHLDTDPHWPELLTTLAGQAAIAIDNNSLFDGLQRSNADLTLAYEATLEGWSRALDLRDKETEGHSQRVTEMAVRLAIALGVPEAALVHIRRGALLHDIGKLGVPDQILLKPGKLTDEEWVIMRAHPQQAYELLAPITFLNPALDIPYCHHEKWDGTGYPRHLKGEAIPLSARIFAVADVWDALGSDRPYRKAWPRLRIAAYVREQSGLQFDPKVVAAFLSTNEV